MKSLNKKSISLVLIFTILMAIFMPSMVNAEIGQQGSTITQTNAVIRSENTVYAGEIFVDGESQMKYLYSSNLANSPVIYDDLRAYLPTDFSGLIPANPSEEPGLAVSSSHQSDMNSSWTSTSYVANQYYTGTVGTETNTNMYDKDSTFKNFVDNQNFGDVEPNKRVLSIGSVQSVTGPAQMIDGVLHPTQILNLELVATTVIYTSVNVTTETTPITPAYRDYVFQLSNRVINDEGSLTREEAIVLEAVLESGLLLYEEVENESIEKFFNKDNKLLFTYNGETRQITIAEGVSYLDNIEYVPTEEEKTRLANEGIYANKFVLSFGEAPSVQNKEYTISNDVATAIFTFEKDHDFVLNMIDLLTINREEAEDIFGVDEETFNTTLETMKNNAKEYGDVLSIYVIEIDDGNIGYTDSVTLKIKLKEAMKKYNTLKLLYLDDANNFKVADVKDLAINSETADVDLDHLSVYALVGSNTETTADTIPTNTTEETTPTTITETETTTSNNPKTGDNIITIFSIFAIATLGAFTTIKLNRNHKARKH